MCHACHLSRVVEPVIIDAFVTHLYLVTLRRINPVSYTHLTLPTTPYV